MGMALIFVLASVCTVLLIEIANSLRAIKTSMDKKYYLNSYNQEFNQNHNASEFSHHAINAPINSSGKKNNWTAIKKAFTVKKKSDERT